MDPTVSKFKKKIRGQEDLRIIKNKNKKGGAYKIENQANIGTKYLKMVKR